VTAHTPLGVTRAHTCQLLSSVQVDSIATSLLAVGGWLHEAAKLAVLGALGLGLVPLLVGAFMELAVLPVRCVCTHERPHSWPSTSG